MANDVLKSVLEWQQLARPVPDDKGRLVAIGVWIEETAEAFTALGAPEIAEPLEQLATIFKTGEADGEKLTFDIIPVNRQELLDAMCDVIVTAVGVCHMLDMDINTAMTRVNDSNWSKFVDGKPVFNEHGKIAKGPKYTAPDLTGLY